MSERSRTEKCDSTSLPADILRLIDLVRSLPDHDRQSIEPVLTRVVDSTRRRRRILSLVQDALGQLRLDMKYLMFDLEATRRERDDYRSRNESEES